MGPHLPRYELARRNYANVDVEKSRLFSFAMPNWGSSGLTPNRNSGLSIVMADLLVEVRPGEPATLTSIAILMSVVSIAACLIPALRATRVDPVIALRAE